MREGSIFTTATRLAEDEVNTDKIKLNIWERQMKEQSMEIERLEKRVVELEGDNLPLANGMLLHNDHISTSGSKRSNKITAPTVLRYPRGG